MTSNLPSLALTDARCSQCGEPLTFDSPPWCFACHDVEMQLLEERIHAEELFREEMRGVRQRARTWQLGKAVQA